MTRIDTILAETARREIEGLTAAQAVERLLELGVLSRRGCEQLAIREEGHRLEREGMRRCEAMHVVSDIFCCSYEKVRTVFYNTFKH